MDTTGGSFPPFEAHDGEMIPRPHGVTERHVPVWHRFLDQPTGDIVEHISHWLVPTGPTGYLKDTAPISHDGQDIGSEMARCFNCGAGVFVVFAGIYRRDGDVLYLRCDDDPEYDAPSTPIGGNV